MHFSSVSACEPSSIATVTLENSSINAVQIYLPALNSFSSLAIGPNSLVISATVNPITVGPGSTLTVGIATPASYVTTVFYQYAIVDGSNKYAGYFSITTRNQSVTLQVLASERNKKWFNYPATDHQLVYYKTGVTTTVTGGTGNFPSLSIPIHVVLDPSTATTFIYSGATGALLTSHVTESKARPVAYKKVVNRTAYNYVNLGSRSLSLFSTAARINFAPTAGGYSAKFNGSSTYIKTSWNLLQFGFQSWTVECWIYPKAFPTIDVGTNWLTQRFNVAMLLANDVNAFGFGKTTIFAVMNNGVAAVGTHDMAINNWYHLAFVRTGNYIAIYVNGVEKAAKELFGTADGPGYTLSNNTWIGNYCHAGSDYNGYLTNLQISLGLSKYNYNFIPSTTLTVNTSSILALNFIAYDTSTVVTGSAIENFVYILTADGYLNKIQVNNLTGSSPNIPAPNQSARKSNWFISGGLSFEEDIPFVGTFADASLLKKQRNLAPGITCVDYYDGIIYVGSGVGIWLLDGDELDILSIITLSFGVASIKAFATGMILTSSNHKIYFLSYAGGMPIEMYSSSGVLGLPDTLRNQLYVPESESSRLVVFNLDNDFASVDDFQPTRFVNISSDFAPSFVAADVEQEVLYVCGHDSDIVYYAILGNAPFAPIQFDNKVAWASACDGSLIASYYLIDQTILNSSLLQRPAIVKQNTRTGPTGALIGTKTHRVKMLYRHTNVSITVPGYSNSTVNAIAAISSMPSWISNFKNSQIYAWANGVKNQQTIGHNDYISVTYRSADTTAVSVRIPVVVGDRHAYYDVNTVVTAVYPKNIFDTKLPNVTAFSTDLNTNILLHFNDTLGTALFVDDATSNSPIYVGNGAVAISNLAAKFDGRSVLFSGGYIPIPASTSMGLGKSDFTVELWIRVTGGGKILFAPATLSSGKWALYLNSTGAVVWHDGTFTYDTGTITVANGAWRHIAVVKKNSTINIYIDGTVATAFVDITDYTIAGTVNYSIGGGTFTVPGIVNYNGYIDELRISNISRYSSKFVPGVPGYILTTPVRPVNSTTNIAQFEAVLSSLGSYHPVAALEYGTLSVNGLEYDGSTAIINSSDSVSVDILFNSTHTVLAPVLTIGKKEYALPINNTVQDLTDNVIEVFNVLLDDVIDYTGQIAVAATGEYYVPNYSTNYISAIKRNGTTLTPGSYVTLTVGDSIDLYGWHASSRKNDTVDVFLIGPRNYQITAETVKTAVPKFMDFGNLITKDIYSANPLVNYGYTSVGNITDPFVRFDYKSNPVTVTGIPQDNGNEVPITLTTDQAYAGVYLIKTAANNTVTTGTSIPDVVNGDKIQIVKRVLNYFETAVILQVSYVDGDTGITDYANVGKWVISQPTITLSNKTYEQVAYSDRYDFGQTTEVAHLASMIPIWGKVGQDSTGFMDQSSLYNWGSNAFGSTYYADRPYTWGSPTHDNANYAERPYTWGSPTHDNANYAERPYTWGSPTHDTANYADRPYSWGKEAFLLAESLRSNTDNWSYINSYDHYFDAGIAWWLDVAAAQKSGEVSKLAVPTFNPFGVVVDDVESVPTFLKSHTYGIRNVNDFDLDDYIVALANVNEKQFFPSPTVGLPPVSDSRRLSSRAYGIDNQYPGVYLSNTYDYGIAAASAPRVPTRPINLIKPASTEQFLPTPVYGIRDASVGTFLPTHTHGIESTPAATLWPYNDLIATANASAGTMWPYNNLIATVDSNAAILWPYNDLIATVDASVATLWTYIDLITTVDASVATMWPYTDLTAIANMQAVTFLSTHSYGIELMHASTLWPHVNHGVRTMHPSTFLPTHTYGEVSELPELVKPSSSTVRMIPVPTTAYYGPEVGTPDFWLDMVKPATYPKTAAYYDPLMKWPTVAQRFMQTPVKEPLDSKPYSSITLDKADRTDRNNIIVAPTYVPDTPNLEMQDRYGVVRERIKTIVTSDTTAEFNPYNFLLFNPTYTPDTSTLMYIGAQVYYNDYNQLLAVSLNPLLNNAQPRTDQFSSQLVKYSELTMSPSYVTDRATENMQSFQAQVAKFNELYTSSIYGTYNKTAGLLDLTADRWASQFRLINSAYARDVNTKINVAPEYKPDSPTKININSTYGRDVATKININSTYGRDNANKINIDFSYGRVSATEINIAFEYLRQFETHMYVPRTVEGLYDDYRSTEIIMSPAYTAFRNLVLVIGPAYVPDRPAKILQSFLPIRDLPTKIVSTINYAVLNDSLWDQGEDFSKFGAFATSQAAANDAAAKNYTDVTIQQILNQTGAIYYTYRVNYNNDFVCGISAPKVPQSGLIKGG